MGLDQGSQRSLDSKNMGMPSKEHLRSRDPKKVYLLVSRWGGTEGLGGKMSKRTTRGFRLVLFSKDRRFHHRHLVPSSCISLDSKNGLPQRKHHVDRLCCERHRLP